MFDTQNTPYDGIRFSLTNTRDPMIFGNNYQAQWGGGGCGG